VMFEGEVVQIGTPEELFETPAHTFVGYFIGSPGMNILPAHVEGRTATVSDHKITLGAEYDTTEGEIEIGIRPEFLKLTKGDTATIDSIEDLGRHKIARVSFKGHNLAVLVPEQEPVKPGPTGLLFDPRRTLVYKDSHLIEGVV